MYGNKPCRECKTAAIEMPQSNEQLKSIEQMHEFQQENKPRKGAGLIFIAGAGLVMFGIPAVFNFFGPGLITFSLVAIVLLLINVLIYKVRKNMTFKKKSKYYNLTRKSEADFMNVQNLCPNCRQLITREMIFCPSCSRHVGEDIPIDMTLTQQDDNRQREVN